MKQCFLVVKQQHELMAHIIIELFSGFLKCADCRKEKSLPKSCGIIKLFTKTVFFFSYIYMELRNASPIIHLPSLSTDRHTEYILHKDALPILETVNRWTSPLFLLPCAVISLDFLA